MVVYCIFRIEKIQAAEKYFLADLLYDDYVYIPINGRYISYLYTLYWFKIYGLLQLPFNCFLFHQSSLVSCHLNTKVRCFHFFSWHCTYHKHEFEWWFINISGIFFCWTHGIFQLELQNLRIPPGVYCIKNILNTKLPL